MPITKEDFENAIPDVTIFVDNRGGHRLVLARMMGWFHNPLRERVFLVLSLDISKDPDHPVVDNIFLWDNEDGKVRYQDTIYYRTVKCGLNDESARAVTREQLAREQEEACQ